MTVVTPGVVAPGVVERETRRWQGVGIALLWAAQLAPWPAVALSQDRPWLGEWPIAVVGSYVAYAVWAAAVAVVVLRRRLPGGRLTAAVVLVMTTCVLAVGLACPPGAVVGWQNWTPAPATGVGMLAMAARGWRWGAAAVAALGGAYAATALLRDPAAAATNGVTLSGQLLQLAAFTAVTGPVCALLRRAARAADVSAAEAQAARAEQARLREQARQRELLHTGVLATLTVVARSAGPLSPELRERVLREADDLRATVRTTSDDDRPDLATALARAVRAQRALGLRIEHRADGLPRDLPADLVEAVVQGTKEALNNVAKHAGTGEATVTGDGDDDRLRVRVTDRGVGFDVAAVQNGVGLARSLGERLHAVGAVATFRSVPSVATVVEITWSR